MASGISPISAANTYVPASQTSQIQLLYQQGVSPAEIAAILGLSAAVVDGYLGISAPAAVVSAPAAVASPPAAVVLPTVAAAPAPSGSAFPAISTIA